MLSLWGAEGTMLFNGACAALVGAKAPHALGCPLAKAWPEAASFLSPALKSGLGGQSMVLADCIVENDKDPESADRYTVTTSPLADENGRIQGVLVIFVAEMAPAIGRGSGRSKRMGGSDDTVADTELQKRIARRTRELHVVRAELRQAQRMKTVGELSGRAAHDFNNLLQAVYACFYLLERRASDSEVRPILDAGFQAVEHAQKLSRQLLTLARTEETATEPFQVRDRLLAMSGLVSRALRENIELMTDFAADLWPVLADSGQFEIIILNLMVNARDAMPKGGHVIVGAENYACPQGEESLAAGDYVRIRIADSGTGMAPEVMQSAFEPGFTTRNAAGAGLAQVNDFCRRAGGVVRLESTPGEGTTVAMFLPRAKLDVQASGEARKAPVTTLGARLLLVEDDVLLAEAVTAALRDTGYGIVHVATGDEALSHLNGDEGVDLLLTDMIMPGSVSGVSLVRAVRALKPHLPILVTTGYSARPLASESVDVLTKPYRIEDLIGAIEAVLAR